MRILVSVVLTLLVSFPIAAQERIISFHSEIIVNKDASLTVIETIDAVAAGEQIKHGIYRDFPTRYQGRNGAVTVVGFKILEILKDGKPEPYHVKGISNGKRIFIGKSDTLLDYGTYEYTIAYRVIRELGFFENRDELYWNVTGNGWVFPIDRATAEVVLPQGVHPNSIAAETYTGLQGSEYSMARYSIDLKSPRVRFHTTEPLASYEGLTIVVTWPTGFVRRRSQAAKALYSLHDHASGIIGFLGLVALLAYYLYTWSMVGKDPERGTIVPQWEIPDGLSPAAIRFVKRMGSDNKAFASALLDMAVKRYIRILKDGKVYSIQKDRTDVSVLPEEERQVADALLSDVDSIILEDTNHVKIRAALRLLGYYLSNRYAAKYFSRNTGYIIPGVIFSAFILWVTSRFQISVDSGVVAVLAFPFIIINLIFYPLMRCVTIPGRRFLDKVEGLRMYLTIAEQDRLDALNPPERTPELFEKFLPYALALDVEQQWAEKFTDVLARAGEGGTAYSPAWYSGASSWSDLGSEGFVSSVGDSLAGAIASSSTAPGSSSGGGGGGSSGGGGGGGGGGGW
jgi:uncharacterized membrane protein YgcG